MDPITTIVAALATGAAAVASADAGQSLRDAYAGLAAGIAAVYPQANAAVLEADPGSRELQAYVQKQLAEAGAGQDIQLLLRAYALLKSVQVHAPETARIIGVDLAGVIAAGDIHIHDIHIGDKIIQASAESPVKEGWQVLLVSHESDFQSVDKIAQRILRYVATVWYEPWNRIPGHKNILSASPPYESAATCAIFIGPNTPTKWLESQIQMALERREQVSDFRVIAVLLPGSTEEMIRKHELGVPADYRGDEEQALHVLVCGMKGQAIGAWQPIMSDRNNRLVEAEEYLRALTNWQQAGLIPETVAIDGRRRIVRNLIAGQSWQR